MRSQNGKLFAHSPRLEIQARNAKAWDDLGCINAEGEILGAIARGSYLSLMEELYR